MITALIAAILLFILGFMAKGAIAHAIIIFCAWITKNVLALLFFNTPTGKRVARKARSSAYSQLEGPGRRRAYKVFQFIGRAEERSSTVLRRIGSAIKAPFRRG